MGGLGAVLGRSWGDMLSSPIFDRFLDRFWSPKGCPKGGILGAKMAPKSIPKRGRNLRAKKLRLGSDLGRFWVVSGGAGRAFLLIFYWFCYCFREKDVFEEDKRPRAIRERKMTKNDPNMPPKTTPRRLQNDIFFDIDFWTNFDGLLGAKRKLRKAHGERSAREALPGSQSLTS